MNLKNLFPSFVVQSLAILFLLAGLASCQTGAEVNLGSGVSLNILDGGTGVSLGQSFTATFNEAIKTETVTTNSFFIVASEVSTSLSSVRAVGNNVLCDETQALAASVSCESDTSCSLTPTASLNANTNYLICLTDAILYKNADTNGLFEAASFSFTTGANPDFAVGGNISDLSGTVVLQNNAGDDLSLSSDGDFQFTTHLADAATYVVTVLTQPAGQTCTVANGSGTINSAAITNVAITCTNDVTEASIAVSGSPLTLLVNGATDTLTITNNSSTVTATNITSNFTATALDGNVTETGNTCASVAPSASCTLTYTPGSTVVSETSFLIQGDNTNAITAAIAIDTSVELSVVSASSGTASGGTGVTLTGVDLTGATSVTFDGVASTSVNVVNSTTVTAVSPAHAVGTVDVVITTPSGSATLTDGYTYLTTAVGQSSFGGTIACLNGGNNNLIAATADNSTSTIWGGFGTTTSATSTTDGATNTATIVVALGGAVSGAKVCSDYEIDSQGNTPCEAGNACYSDWFLPAGNNLTGTGQLNCLYSNQVTIGGFSSSTYLSSTESSANVAWVQNFSAGVQSTPNKLTGYRVRCVRAFTP